ncbi:hypothetical protein LSTR_LSTR011339 [Laodelphax striatellus]|uniref:Uncharacterized protein n=1 Tax=Laodelphax striatellus TaxID=195883 RepID=A0A482XT84_LAOST|nr:hypothetical protein LSTR_LSTR011339 [Laodelphax striatellus]
MNGKSSGSVSVKTNKDNNSIICQEDTTQERFKLTFYPDGANLLDKERMQKIWNHIESESRCQEIMFGEKRNEVKLKCSKNDEKMGNERSDSINEKRRGIEKEMDNKEETLETTRTRAAIELLDHFNELHMIEDCIRILTML